MLMARLYTGNLGMISLRNAYHGGSSGTIGLTALNTWKYPIPEVCLSMPLITIFQYVSWPLLNFNENLEIEYISVAEEPKIPLFASITSWWLQLL